MKIIISLFFAILATFDLSAQSNTPYLSFFDNSDIQKSQTAAHLTQLSQEEKESVLWTNLVRVAPQKFYQMLLKYIENHPEIKSNSPYVISLLEELQSTASLPPLYVESLLNSNAKSHADYSAKTLRKGHDNFDKRAEMAFKQQFRSYGENCVYYITDPLHAVISLLIDEGVRDLGHRKIILSNMYNQIGVAMMNYNSSQYKVLVQQFGSKNIDKRVASDEPGANGQPTSSIHNTPVSNTSSTLKKMYIQGKYVIVDTSKYYTPEEYRRYVLETQKVKGHR